MKNYRLFSLLIVVLALTGCERNPAGPELNQFSWNFSTPEAQEINPQTLASAFAEAESKGFVDGLLVIRNGMIVAEEYYNGYTESIPHNIKSVSKSFLSVITGIALNQGLIKSLDEKVLDYFPEYIYAGIDVRKFDITIRHLLTMQMGIDGEADNSYELYSRIYRSDNWIKKTIELPLVHNPGQEMRYNTFQTHLLSVIISKASGQSTFQYARNNLCNLMGIDIDSWEQGPQGYYFGGNSMFFTPREMAVLGLLYLNEGRINGTQVIPQEWIGLSTTKTWAEDRPEWGVLTDYNYGYLWWLGTINGYKLYLAIGYGGQLVLVFPTLNLIVVSTANEKVSPDAVQIRPILEIVSKYILTAMRD